ncbi:MAG: hypothetical protein QOI24_1424 [Acidobacteriota bacterium]|jgi:hypothetical protein|nr:hypothetical protein [Acidobacteriota bacterium]
MRVRERAGAVGLVVVGLILRVLCFLNYRFDSDEPQHLHVAWGWTRGFVQYRDFFDNHAPLFHMVTAPILSLVGERSDALLWMRAPMLFLFAVVLGVTYAIGKRWEAVLLLAFFPPFFLKSLEYRTDNLWTALWMLALLALIRKKAFLAGLLLGLAFCVSLKTLLLIVTVGGAVAITGAMKESRWAVAGIPIAPAILAWYFHIKGAWPQLVLCVFTFNTRGAEPSPLRFAWPFAMAALLAVAWRFRKNTDAFLATTAAIFTITLVCFWTLISPRDFLPIMPIAAILLAAAIPRAATLALCALFAASIAWYAKPLVNQTDEQITMLNQVLGMTRPGEPLMDYKGETIFRRRPFYYIFEKIGRGQVRSGLIVDTIPESIIVARCHAAQADGAFWPPRGREFMLKNFLDMGRIRASGQWIGDDGTFTIAVPGDYLVVDPNGLAEGTLDGAPQLAPRSLEAGPHQFARAHDGPLAVMWAPAFARGYSPFHLRDREF